jgi:hypothetical protein
MDAGYTEAFDVLSQTYERMGRTELAQQALQKAAGSLVVPVDEQVSSPRVRKTAPLFQQKKTGTLRLMAGVDKRIADALREDALRAFKMSSQQSH